MDNPVTRLRFLSGATIGCIAALLVAYLPIWQPPVVPVANAIAQPKAAQVVSKQTVAAKSSPNKQTVDMFAGGFESFVARTVGAAEGTRTVDGGKTSLWEHHTDPGNFVENCGTFSYQFGYGKISPEQCDVEQLKKIKSHYENTVLPQAKDAGIELTLYEKINAIDLANQAPLCITEAGGFIERLVEMRKKGKENGWDERKIVLEARVWSYWSPAKGDWDASGLRAYDDVSKEASIRHDQDRRMYMIDQAIVFWNQQKPGVIPASYGISDADILNWAIAHNPYKRYRVTGRAIVDSRFEDFNLGAWAEAKNAALNLKSPAIEQGRQLWNKYRGANVHTRPTSDRDRSS